MIKRKNRKEKQFRSKYPFIQVVSQMIPCQGNQQIASVLFRNSFSNRYLVIYSHGNSTDIGYLRKRMLEMSKQLSVDVLCYDYCGYGCSSGFASELAIINNIESVYNYAKNTLHYEWKKIIMYGQSIGTGPTIFLASQVQSPVCGLILHSAFTSGLRIKIPDMKKTNNYDFFPNIELIKCINCPIFIMHGMEDRVIPCSHSEQLYAASNKLREPWYVPHADHNDIEHSDQTKATYYQKLKEFLDSLQEINSKYKEHELLQKNQAA